MVFQTVPKSIKSIADTARVCTFGDSILRQAHEGTDASPDTLPGAITERNRGVFPVLNALMGQRFYYGVKWIGSMATNFEVVGYNAGITGFKIQDCIDNVSRVTRLKTPGCDACLLLVGTNDIDGDSTTLANMKTQYEQLANLIIGSGIALWGLPIMPKNAVDGANDWNNSGERLRHLAFNDWMRTLDRSTGKEFTLLDWYSALVDPTTGDMTTGFTSDGLHFSAKGANAAAKFIQTKLESSISSYKSMTYFSSVIDLVDATDNPCGNLWTPAVFTGTSGTSDTGITGPVPDNVNIDSEDTTNLSAVTSIISAPTDFDQFGGNWLRIVCTSDGNGSGEKFFRMQKISPTISVPSGTVNQWFKAGCFIKIGLPSVDNLLFGVYVKFLNVTPNISAFSLRDADLTMETEAVIHALETQPLLIADDTATVRLEVFIELDAGVSGNVTIDIGQPYIRPIPITPLFGDE